MTPDMDVLVEANTDAAILLRPSDEIRDELNFDLMWRAVGKTSDDAIANEIGMHTKTVGRARNGVIGKDFIANTLNALRQHQHLLTMCNLEPTFEKVFLIVPPGSAS